MLILFFYAFILILFFHPGLLPNEIINQQNQNATTAKKHHRQHFLPVAGKHHGKRKSQVNHIDKNEGIYAFVHLGKFVGQI